MAKRIHFCKWKDTEGMEERTCQETSDAEPGTVMGTDAQGIHVACKDGVLILTEVQLEGKKRMEAEVFLRDIIWKQEHVLQIIRSD